MDNDDPELLRPVLARFAHGWGQSVDCAEGWWLIIAKLDRDISAIAAEREAARTCEFRGAPGRARGRGWIKTVCDEHA